MATNQWKGEPTSSSKNKNKNIKNNNNLLLTNGEEETQPRAAQKKRRKKRLPPTNGKETQPEAPQNKLQLYDFSSWLKLTSLNTWSSYTGCIHFFILQIFLLQFSFSIFGYPWSSDVINANLRIYLNYNFFRSPKIRQQARRPQNTR